MNKLSHKLSIPEWYAGKTLFISGATGFMGKVLVEKLLRDCSDVKEIYLLIRTKKGIDPYQRREEYINHMVFDNIRKINSDQFKKIRVVKGDVTEDGLGISEKDQQDIAENVQLIFHCAANVRFDQPLKGAVNFNTNGTMRMLKLAESIKNLKGFIHVSTAYCQCNEPVLEEKAYAPPQNPHGISQLAKLLDNDILEIVTPRLLNNLPNTYAYTKALTEDLVHSCRHQFPVAIARPSIVTASWKEPMPGWVEGVNGPTGLMIGAGRGILRSMHCNKDYNADLMPVDVSINAIIALGWERGNNGTEETLFCNIVASPDNIISWGDALDKGREVINANPFCFALWYPDGSIKSNYYHHLLCVILFHYIPAYFIDFLLFLMRKKPFMLKIQKRISGGLEVLQYYTTKVWDFRHENMKTLHEKLSEKDKETFFFDMNQINWRSYLEDYILGTREYSLKEAPETIPQARKMMKKLYLMDKLVQLIVYGLGLWFLWSYFGIITGSIQFIFDSTLDGVQSVFVRTPVTITS